jgi:hypothetical protein
MPLKGGVSACPAGNLKQQLHTAGFGDSQSWVVGNATKKQRVPRSIVEHLMRQIMHHDKEFRREEATSAVSSNVKH